MQAMTRTPESNRAFLTNATAWLIGRAPMGQSLVSPARKRSENFASQRIPWKRHSSAVTATAIAVAPPLVPTRLLVFMQNARQELTSVRLRNRGNLLGRALSDYVAPAVA